MKQREIVSLVIRIAGVAGIFKVLLHWFRIYHVKGHIHFNQPWVLLAEVCLILIGFYMISGAPFLLNLICPKDGQDKDNGKQN